MSASTTRPSPWREGAHEALRAPLWVLGVGYIGFGSLARTQDFGLLQTLLSTMTIWALPGQLILVEMHALSAPLVATVLAVVFSASRFLPMTVALLPMLRTERVPSWKLFLAAHVLAMSAWAVAMRRMPTQAPRERLPFFFGFAATMWTGCLAATAAGYLLAARMPEPVTLAFVFSNPLYFLLLLAPDLRRLTPQSLALAAGAVAGPLAHFVVPQCSVVIGGVVGGTVAFALAERRRRG